MSELGRKLVFTSLLGLLAAPGFTLMTGQGPAASRAVQEAETLIVNAKIHTVTARQPWADGVAIAGGKILAVGNSGEVERYRGDHTQVIDAKGHLLLPGFTDCHIHFLEGAIDLGMADLHGATNVQQVQEIVKKYTADHPEGWILGRGWAYEAFGPAALPDKKDIDAVVPDRPVLLESYDTHTYGANSRALQLAGITRDTPDPPNGQIVRDPHTGEPTGALKDAAAPLVERVIPPPTRDEKIAAIRIALQMANRAGLVRIHALGSNTAAALHDFPAIDIYEELRRRGQLTLRMTIAPYLDPQEGLTPRFLDSIEAARKEYDGDMLSGGLVKIMLDGAVESHTAAMLDPYADDLSQRGAMFWSAAQYKAAVAELDRRGFQVATHATREAAVRLALDGYEAVARINGTKDRRHRIEHVETISAADVPRFGKLGVIASMQPLHAYPDPGISSVWARNAGPDRAERGFGWESIAKAGGRLAFGSDWDVVTLNPWEGVQCAVTRQTADGMPPGGWVPNQRVSLAQAIEAYTLGAAFAGHREKTEGSLETGKVADLILLDQNLFEVDPRKIGKTQVLVTMVGGKIVYHAADWAGVTVRNPPANAPPAAQAAEAAR